MTNDRGTMNRLSIAIYCAGLLACGSSKNLQPPSLPEGFNGYWQQGKAELSRYSLVQARYGNLNQGELIVITVTEPFHSGKQVKSDVLYGDSVQSVMKAQTMRRFTTGIYDYAITTTSFKTIDEAVTEPAKKITATSVDWCGHTFAQLNLRRGNYQVESRSYFESEGDENFSTEAALSEDEIWQRIRLAPDRLPQAGLKVLPALASARLRHRRIAAEEATASLSDYEGSDFSGKNLRNYRLIYAKGLAGERSVDFVFERDFPHKIVGYTEEYADGFVAPKRLKTIARLTKQLMSDYWVKHDPQHEPLRKTLGVKGFSN